MKNIITLQLRRLAGAHVLRLHGSAARAPRPVVPRLHPRPARGLDRQALQRENVCHRGTGGVSAENRVAGFRPAFLDTQTHSIYLSRFANGEPAPCHLLDGLPDEVVTARSSAGQVTAVKATLVSGFVLDGCFYDREAAARKLAMAA